MPQASIRSRSRVNEPSYATSHSVTVIRWTLARSISRVMTTSPFPSVAPLVSSGRFGWASTLRPQNDVVDQPRLSGKNRHGQQRFRLQPLDRLEAVGVDERQIVHPEERLLRQDFPARL